MQCQSLKAAREGSTWAWIVEEICIPRGDVGRLVMVYEAAETECVWVDACGHLGCTA